MLTREVFARRLAKARSQRGLTQQQLGERVGLTGSRIAQMENGGGFPRKDKLRPMARTLKVKADSLFGKDLAAQAV